MAKTTTASERGAFATPFRGAFPGVRSKWLSRKQFTLPGEESAGTTQATGLQSLVSRNHWSECAVPRITLLFHLLQGEERPREPNLRAPAVKRSAKGLGFPPMET